MRRALLAVVAGIAAGAAGAAVQADAPPPRRQMSTAQAPVPVGVRVLGQRIVVRVTDPAGGPMWALKRIESVRLKDGRPVGRPQTCIQLGRLRDDVFGWFFGDRSFRALGAYEQPLQCMPATWEKPMAQFTSTLAIIDPAAPKITAGVVWGRFPGAARVTVSGTEGADGAVATADGAFLRVFAAAARPPAGARVRGAGVEVPLGPGPIPARARKSYPRVIPGTERVEARTRTRPEAPATASSWPTRAKACPASQAPPRSSTGGPEAPTSSSASSPRASPTTRSAAPSRSVWIGDVRARGAPGSTAAVSLPVRSSGGHGTNAACRSAGPCSRRSAGQTWNA